MGFAVRVVDPSGAEHVYPALGESDALQVRFAAQCLHPLSVVTILVIEDECNDESTGQDPTA